MTTKELLNDAKYNYAFSFYKRLFNEKVIDESELIDAEKYLRQKYNPLAFKSLL